VQDREDLIHCVEKLLNAHGAISFFLNGGPGTGKSHLLEQLVDQLPEYIGRTFPVFTRVSSERDFADLARTQLGQCKSAGFVDGLPPASCCDDVGEAWTWFSENAESMRQQLFAVLVDLDIEEIPLRRIADFFSQVRSLEKSWRRGAGRILYLIAGRWDNESLRRHFNTIGASFPYSEGINYFIWHGVTQDEIERIVLERHPDALPYHAAALRELVGGNPGAAVEALATCNNDILTIDELLSSVKEIANESQLTTRLLSRCTEMSAMSQQLVKQLMHTGINTYAGWREAVSQLAPLGIVDKREIGGAWYLVFRSWYVELVFRLNGEKLGLAGGYLADVPVDELVPRLTSVSTLCFEIVNETENWSRNLLIAELSSLAPEGKAHVLEGLDERLNTHTGTVEDAHHRAQEWRKRSQKNGGSSDINPLVAYCSTRDLAKLFGEVAGRTHVTHHTQLAAAIRGLADLRDSVMHSQVVTDDELRRLYGYRDQILSVMAELATPEYTLD